MARQTISYLMKRLGDVGIHPKSQHGQNFLIDFNLLEMIAATADLRPTDVVLEVGTGTGSLTALVAPQVAEVVSVEVDPQMHQLASEELIDFENVSLRLHDALAGKHKIDPDLLEVLAAKLAVDPQRKLKLVANLPYHIATPLISNLLMGPLVPMSMTVTIQKELGDRICASPGTRDYSALSVWVQCQAETRVVRIMQPTVFWPRPKVESAIVQIDVDFENCAAVGDLPYFHQFVRTIFLQRRKFLRSALVNSFKQELTKPEIDAVLARLGFHESCRAEELPWQELLRLSGAMREAIANAAK
ncbi:MAG: 16S rRNA (adenine(1518)-N(6)/adenine(1519)-N(6))-dimethyltransferase RsmA [Pirellulales bacterium]